jgi:hypothetical protein
MSKYNIPTDKERGIEDECSQRVRLERLRAERKIVFLQWLEASKAWSSLCHSAEEDGDELRPRGPELAGTQNLQVLEQQINFAAEAFERLQDRIGTCQ